MAINVDFSDVPTNEPVPDGRYPVVVEQAEIRDSKSSDSQYINWELRIMDGEYANRRLFMMTSLSKKALWRLRAVLKNLGCYPGDKFTIEKDEGSGIMLFPQVVGATGVAVSKIETYQGEERSRTEELLDDNGQDVEKMERKEARAAAKQAPRGRASRNGDDDDEVPAQKEGVHPTVRPQREKLELR